MTPEQKKQVEKETKDYTRSIPISDQVSEEFLNEIQKLIKESFIAGAEYRDSLDEWISVKDVNSVIDWCINQQEQVKTAGEELGYNSDAIIQHYGLMVKKLKSLPKK